MRKTLALVLVSLAATSLAQTQALPRVMETSAAKPMDAATLAQFPTTRDHVDGDDQRGFKVDLNGDGTAEFVRVFGPRACGTGGCPYEIFDGRTRKLVGDLFGNPVWIVPATINGWPTLGVYSHRSATSGSYQVMVFDGTRYSPVSTVLLEGPSVETLFSQYKSATPVR